MLKTTTRVQAILDEVGALVFPGVYDTLSAKVTERVGFPLAFISGYAVSATFIGEPDLGLLTQTEIVDRARRICRSVGIPIIVDADTGYGNPLNVHPHGQRADRHRCSWLLSGGSRMAQKVRAHARQEGHRT